MDEKTKSIIIGLVAAFAAVIIIILLFFSISGINGSGTDNKGKSNKRSYSESVSVDSEGNRVVIIDDEDNLQISKFDCEYRATRREELTKLLISDGCRNVVWKYPEETGFYQPIVIARK